MPIVVILMSDAIGKPNLEVPRLCSPNPSFNFPDVQSRVGPGQFETFAVYRVLHTTDKFPGRPGNPDSNLRMQIAKQAPQ